MNTGRTLTHTLFLLLVVICAWLGIILQYVTAIPNYLEHDKSLGRAHVLFLSYFTILTNLVVAVTTSFILLFSYSKPGRFCSKSAPVTAVTLYIVVVGLVYNLVLRPLYHFQGLTKIADEIVHSVVPLLVLIYWLIFTVKGRLQWTDTIMWLVYPLLYLVYTFLHGMFTGYYPYPFIDVNEIGDTGFWLNSLYMLLLFLFLSFVLIGINKILGRKKEKQLIAI